MSFSSDTDLPNAHAAEASRRLVIGFLNWAHAIDHFVILIYPTVVIELAVIYDRSYSTLIALSTASFVAFGLLSLPARWLGDHWSRRNLMLAFYVGCGLSLVAAAFAPSWTVLAIALCSLHIRSHLSSGRHRHGRRARQRSWPHTGVQWRLRQFGRVTRGRHHRRADCRIFLARRFSRARS